MLAIVALPFLAKAQTSKEISPLKTFVTMCKELSILKKDKETDLFNYKGNGCITYIWFGGSSKKNQ